MYANCIKIGICTQQKSTSRDVLFCLPRGWIGGFSNRRALCAPNHLSVLTLGQFAQVQPCAIKRIHPPRKSVLFCTVFLCGAGWIRLFSNSHTLRVSNHLSVLTLGQFAQVQPCAIKRIAPSPLKTLKPY